MYSLNALYSDIYIPYVVLQEIEGLDISGLFYTPIKIINKTLVTDLLGTLHRGEVEVIVSAIEHNIQDVILDDLAARNKAKQFGLNVTGTLGVLRRGKNKNLIINLEQEIQLLRDNGMYLTDDIVQAVLRFD